MDSSEVETSIKLESAVKVNPGEPIQITHGKSLRTASVDERKATGREGGVVVVVNDDDHILK